MKGYIAETVLEEQGWWLRIFTILLILTWELRYYQKIGVNRKMEDSFRSCFAWEGANDLPLGRKYFPGATGILRNYRDWLKKLTSSKTGVKNFPYTLTLFKLDVP